MNLDDQRISLNKKQTNQQAMKLLPVVRGTGTRRALGLRGSFKVMDISKVIDSVFSSLHTHKKSGLPISL